MVFLDLTTVQQQFVRSETLQFEMLFGIWKMFWDCLLLASVDFRLHYKINVMKYYT